MKTAKEISKPVTFHDIDLRISAYIATATADYLRKHLNKRRKPHE